MTEGPSRILLVDDEQAIPTLLSYPLRKDGYEVVLVADGRAALNRFAETSFDRRAGLMRRPGGVPACAREELGPKHHARSPSCASNVAPTLASSLRDQKLQALAAVARSYSAPLAATVGADVNRAGVEARLRHAATLSGARVTLLGVTTHVTDRSPGLGTCSVADSSLEAPNAIGSSDLQFPVAAEAAAGGRTLTATEEGAVGLVGQAAQPLFFRHRVAEVAIYSQTLNGIDHNLALIRRRILIASAIARELAERMRGTLTLESSPGRTCSRSSCQPEHQPPGE